MRFLVVILFFSFVGEAAQKAKAIRVMKDGRTVWVTHLKRQAPWSRGEKVCALKRGRRFVCGVVTDSTKRYATAEFEQVVHRTLTRSGKNDVHVQLDFSAPSVRKGMTIVAKGKRKKLLRKKPRKVVAKPQVKAKKKVVAKAKPKAKKKAVVNKSPVKKEAIKTAEVKKPEPTPVAVKKAPEERAPTANALPPSAPAPRDVLGLPGVLPSRR